MNCQCKTGTILKLYFACIYSQISPGSRPGSGIFYPTATTTTTGTPSPPPRDPSIPPPLPARNPSRTSLPHPPEPVVPADEIPPPLPPPRPTASRSTPEKRDKRRSFQETGSAPVPGLKKSPKRSKTAHQIEKVGEVESHVASPAVFVVLFSF